MEYIDVLDKNGNKVGIVKNKNKIYKDSDWHRSVHIWIINDNKEILVQRRNPNKETFPNLWAISVAGHVRTDEDALEACIREIKEEIGLDIKKEELKYLFTINRIQDFKDFTLKVIDEVYILKKNLNPDALELQKEELVKVKFMPYIEYKNCLLSKDDSFVPMSEEHEKLFPILDKVLIN